MLTDAVKDTIQQAYRRWLESKGLKARYGQRLMIAEVARALANADDPEQCAIGVVEAGTGTGKTMAYSVAAIPVAQALEKKLVIATATVALQEQIVYKDLPDLLKNSGLIFNFTLAKGRGRYLCLAKLDTTLAAQPGFNPALALYPDEMQMQLDSATSQVLERMLDKLGSGDWDGDRDLWPEPIAENLWGRVSTDHAQCTGRRCAHVRQCSFFKARDNLDQADVIVTNHDLVLADLALGGGAILPDPEDTLYIFDEGHHLPDKARDHFAYSSRLRATDKWLDQSIKVLATAAAELGAADSISRQLEVMPSAVFEARQLLASVRPPLEELLSSVVEQRDGRERGLNYRFEHGLVPDFLREQAGLLRAAFEEIAERLGRVAAALQDSLDGNGSVARDMAERWLPPIAMLRARADANRELWFYYARDAGDEKPPRARWIAGIESNAGMLDIELHCSPIIAAGTLSHHLWSRCAGAIVTSATLTALGKFDRFAMRSGVPKDAQFAVVPSPFDHATAGVLSVPPMSADPTDPQKHTDMVVEMLPRLLNGDEGSLVLFASRKQMEQVFAELDASWQEKILRQDTFSKHEILTRHRAQIDAGIGSVIFGLASFAEGVDLPGAYCQHVIIAKIPFAVPDEPVEAALAEWIESRGGNAFMEIAVPDAALKLVQASGRLLRSESDRGRITLLDRRIVTKQYGRAILASLPPFKQEITR
ncbi:MAG: ATP-dependent helicase DinG [Verrucomicrobiaceae bacterium]|nr:ATP-dependent helicase DinG [Verrucomicrobiaceae bacterium]